MSEAPIHVAMARVRYTGAPGAVNRDVGAETGAGDLLEPGRIYDVSDELAGRLVASCVFWRPAGRKRAAEGELGEELEGGGNR